MDEIANKGNRNTKDYVDHSANDEDNIEHSYSLTASKKFKVNENNLESVQMLLEKIEEFKKEKDIVEAKAVAAEARLAEAEARIKALEKQLEEKDEQIIGYKENELSMWSERAVGTLIGLIIADAFSPSSVELDECGIDDDKLQGLLKCIKHSHDDVIRLNLRGNYITDDGIEEIANFDFGDKEFEQFDISMNKGITEESIPNLIKIMQKFDIENIDVDDTSISPTLFEAAIALAKGGYELDISYQDVNDEQITKIFGYISEYDNKNLGEIDIDNQQQNSLSDNAITSKGASKLLDTLRELNSCILALNLSNNQLDDQCMKSLGEFLECNEHFVDLRLDGNQITDNGIEILTDHIIGNTAIKALGLGENKGITNVSVPFFIEIAKHSSMGEIEMSGTTIDDEKQEEIEELLSISVDERAIPIKSNTKSAAKIISAST